MTKHYDVVIATPGHSMQAGYVKSLMKTVDALNERGLTYCFVSEYSSFVSTAREMTALGGSTSGLDFQTTSIVGGCGYQKIFWIDSDMEWEPSDFLKLFDSGLDIVSGLYVLDEAGSVAVGYANEDGMPTRVNKVEFLLVEEPVEVMGVGFGFLAVKAGVFEAMERPWFGIGRIEIEGRRWNVGEDYSWCAKAKGAGYSIFVDPSVKVGHNKNVVFRP